MHGQISRSSVVDLKESIDVYAVMDFIVRRWFIVLIGFLVGASLAVALAFTMTPRYTSVAEILLDSSSRKGLGTNLSSDVVIDQDVALVENQIAIINSTNLLKRVVEKENLVNDPEFGADAGSASSWGSVLKGWLGSSPSAVDNTDAKGDAIPPDVLASISALRDALKVARIGRSNILQISVTSTDSQKAARLANAVADAFIVDQLETRYDAARRASDWLTDRLQKLRDALRASEEMVSQFKTENNLVSVGGQTLNEQQLSEINAELVKVQTEAAEKKAKYEQAKQVQASGGNVAALPDVMRSTVIGNLRSRVAEVAAREADLVTRYGERHPLVVNVRAERREAERQLNGEIERVVTNLKNDYDVAKSRAEAMAENVAAASGQKGVETTLTVKLRELERDAAANRTLYETFLNQSKLASEQSQVTLQDARIITPAVPSPSPSFPKKSFFLVGGGFVGLLVGLGVAILLEMLNAGFNSPRQVEEQTGLPVLASVEWVDFNEVEREAGSDQVATTRYLLAKPLSRYSESIRSLRAGIQMSDVDNPPHVIEVTSSSPGEGKTSLAISLAVSAAMSGKRVVLVDCDLRRPSISQQFGLDGKDGLVELLAQTASSEGILHRDPGSGVYVLGSGGKTQNPPDLLGSARMAQLIEQLRQSFDVVVLDAPPVGPVVDSVVLAPMVDKVLFVIRWNATAREFVRHSISSLPGDRKICGIAFNMVDLRRTPKYGRYSYYSSAYYKKYYVG